MSKVTKKKNDIELKIRTFRLTNDIVAILDGIRDRMKSETGVHISVNSTLQLIIKHCDKVPAKNLFL